MRDYLWQLEGKRQEKTEEEEERRGGDKRGEEGNKRSTDIYNHMFHNYSLMLKELVTFLVECKNN